MTSTSECILIHDQSPKNYYSYTPLVTYLSKHYDKVHYYCSNEMIDMVTWMYRGIPSVVVIEINSCEHVKLFNMFRKMHGMLVDVLGFGSYDVLRTDKYKGMHLKKQYISQDIQHDTYVDLLNLCKTYDLSLDVNFEDGLILQRDLSRESVFWNQFNKYISFDYAIISQERFRKLHKNSMTIVNIMTMFPKNKNMFYLLKLIDNSNEIIITDDKLGMMLFFMISTKNYDKRNISFVYNDSMDLSFYDKQKVNSWKWIKG